MKEFKNKNFGIVLSMIFNRLVPPFFVFGLVAVAILRIFFLDSEDSFNVFIFVVIITCVLLLLGFLLGGYKEAED
ncbi:hypothetical protein IT402_00840 [Candidatus Nomurabacteria bacterium]|nr:hypothetical protein [Candidatus Nomurabacteria bacterium]